MYKKSEKKKFSNKSAYKVAVAFSSIMQTALSLLTPIFICIVVAKYLTEKFSLPPFVMILGIILGVASGFYSMIKYIISAVHTADRSDDDAK